MKRTRTECAIGAAVYALLIIALVGCCPPGGLRREAIAPSVNAVTGQLDVMLDEAVAKGEMDPVEAETWKSEGALLRGLVEPPEAPEE